MVGSYYTRDPDPAEYMPSMIEGYHYRCTSVEDVDHHIQTIRNTIGPGTNLSEHRCQQLTQDIDRLLERRLYLEQINNPR